MVCASFFSTWTQKPHSLSPNQKENVTESWKKSGGKIGTHATVIQFTSTYLSAVCLVVGKVYKCMVHAKVKHNKHHDSRGSNLCCVFISFHKCGICNNSSKKKSDITNQDFQFQSLWKLFANSDKHELFPVLVAYYPPPSHKHVGSVNVCRQRIRGSIDLVTEMELCLPSQRSTQICIYTGDVLTQRATYPPHLCSQHQYPV